MAEDEAKQDNQKTIVAFIGGLLIGGLLVWVFAGSPGDQSANVSNTDDGEVTTSTDDTIDEADDDSENIDTNDDEQPSQNDQSGDAAIDVDDQTAGRSVAIESATFPNDEGWIAVRSYQNGQFGNILGAARFSRTQGLIPESVPLLVPTVAGRTYAIVFFTENGDRNFNLATDVQVEGIWETFEAE